MSLSDDVWNDGEESCHNMYYEDNVKEAINKILINLKKFSEKKDNGYEEFERGYKIAYKHLIYLFKQNFGDALLGVKE